MLGYLFGFNARLGRLHYFLATLGLYGTSFLAFFALAFVIAMTHSDDLRPALYWPVIGLTGLIIWGSVMLQAMRLRDIGWDPVCVLPLWFAAMALDHVVAMKLPVWSLSMEHPTTIAGLVVNAGLGLALLFWPGGAEDTASQNGGRAANFAPRGPRRRPPIPEIRLAHLNGDLGHQSR